ncbi:MAG: glycosyltransferase family 4 protein [Deltaproteobacteria bacterium]|uniref:Glycosyltransferase family 4 protein n=1 Tax=Candidatus Zymogenus saltonus TaxID=2844893 RepID=A0A9D8KJB9_9DELT|nr:glycosyltransferase family 4 protein [Candidatus Zymogenus saltonus]
MENNKKNILIVESGAGAGGTFRILYQHLKIINQTRFIPVVVFLNENMYIELVKELGFPVHLLNDLLYTQTVPSLVRRILNKILVLSEKNAPSFYLFFARIIHRRLVRSLKKIVRENSIDLIHLNDQVNRDLFGLFLAEETDIACVCSLQSIQSGGFDGYRAEYANRVVNLFFANTDYTRNHWLRKGINKEQTRVVYNATEIEKPITPLNLYSAFGIDKKVKFSIGTAGRLVDWKSQDLLIKAFALLAKARKDAVLLIVGDGPMRKYLEDLVGSLGIDREVVFTGFSTKAREIISALDIFVLPSLNEPFGIVIVEAMFMGTPVVATNSGGVPEIVKHEHNGLLVEYGDEEGLAEAMERLIVDKNLCKRIVENGYRTVEEKFTIERYAREVENIYEEALKSNLK